MEFGMNDLCGYDRVLGHAFKKTVVAWRYIRAIFLSGIFTIILGAKLFRFVVISGGLHSLYKDWNTKWCKARLDKDEIISSFRM